MPSHVRMRGAEHERRCGDVGDAPPATATADDARDSIACLSDECGVLAFEDGHSGEGRMRGEPYCTCCAGRYTESMDCTGEDTTDVERETSRERADDAVRTRDGPARVCGSGGSVEA